MMGLIRLSSLRVLAGVALASLLTSHSALAQGKEVRLLSWGGTVQTMLEKEGWADRFAKDTGYTVVLVPKATSAEIIATAIAQKDKPQIDVVMCDLVAYLQGMEQGIFAKLEVTTVPNLAKMLDVAKVKDQGIMTYADILAIIYHEDVFKNKGWAPPKTWSDLMRPEFKGQLIIPPVSNTYGLYTLIEMARLHGGSEKNIEPGFEALKKLAPNVVDWTTTFAKIGSLMQSETASVAVFGNASGWEIKGRGTPVNVVIPEPAYMSPTIAGLMKGSPNPDGAAIFLNWLISEKVLAYRAERFGQTPMNREVKVTGEAASRVLSGDQLAKLVKLDYEQVVAKRAEWNQRFEREIAPIK
jgi:putative spermidine/putrescine transport system substrate-binding protein